MRRDTERGLGGYASLVALGAVFAVTGFVAAWAAPYLYRVHVEDGLRMAWSRKAALEARAASIIEELSDSTRGDAEEMFSFELPAGAILSDSGSRIDLNWVRVYVLRDSPVLLGLFSEGSPEELQAFRAESSLGTSLVAYESFFAADALNEHFTARSPMNVNSVDEFSFENVMGRATGDAASGAAWRERLKELRRAAKTIDGESALRSWFGVDWDKVALFATASPEWNANSLSPFLLGAILSCSDFAIADPTSAAAALIEARSGRYLSDSDLRTILGLPEDNPIWKHLGADSRAWTLSVSDPSGLRIELDFSRRSEAESGGAFRLTGTRWTHD